MINYNLEQLRFTFIKYNIVIEFHSLNERLLFMKSNQRKSIKREIKMLISSKLFEISVVILTHDIFDVMSKK